MAFGFPARFSASRAFNLEQDKLVEVVKEALGNLGWTPFEFLPENEFRKFLHNSMLTWGEDFKVKILPGGIIEVESRCTSSNMPQIFDYGVNRKNVEAFFAEIERMVSRFQNKM
jgi:hypothetical protein